MIANKKKFLLHQKRLREHMGLACRHYHHWSPIQIHILTTTITKIFIYYPSHKLINGSVYHSG
ncbi:hypothetical protein DERF_007326 [Dermatophagoides farinae]|uniref:Uncharacterized protein n=1 Tax=Dermatophagoides farinae TaxID=6954 RepID=A0A922I047_DERFA|nr:hypothetical protein DERF_007326 [Dermatophagoides farinae]